MRTGLTVLLLCLLVSPIGMALVVILVERRPFKISDQYEAFLIGDTLLALAAGAGFAAAGERPLWSPWLLIPLAVGVLFGLWQTAHEVASATYTQGQAHSPSKLYHQFICYPVLGALTCRTLYLASGQWLPLAMVTILIAGWGATNVWDWSHPKHPHQDFNWHTLTTERNPGAS